MAAALRGDGHPRWAAGILQAFRSGITGKSRFYGIVGETLVAAEKAIATEEAKEAAAERVRQEAKARGEKKGVNYLYADGHIKNLLVVEGAIQR